MSIFWAIGDECLHVWPALGGKKLVLYSIGWVASDGMLLYRIPTQDAYQCQLQMVAGLVDAQMDVPPFLEEVEKFIKRSLPALSAAFAGDYNFEGPTHIAPKWVTPESMKKVLRITHLYSRAVVSGLEVVGARKAKVSQELTVNIAERLLHHLYDFTAPYTKGERDWDDGNITWQEGPCHL